MITNAGGVAAVVDFIKESKGNVRLPGIMMLGYVAAHSETLAMSVIVSKVCKLNVIRLLRFQFVDTLLRRHLFVTDSLLCPD